MGTVKVTNIEPIADNGTVTLGGSGDNLVIGSGAVPKFNYPAFEAILSANTNISDATTTKVECDTEVFDTDNAYDNSTNYRFTPQVAGKYYVYAYARCQGSVSNRLLNLICQIYKNGSAYRSSRHNFNSNETIFTNYIFSTIELNGSTDYVEFFQYIDVTSGTPLLHQANTMFGAYRIGG